MADPAHLIRVEGTAERLREIGDLEGVNFHSASIREAGPTRYLIHGVATDSGISELRAMGLDVEVVEDAAARAERIDAMAQQIREAESE
jgi:hypothetical protein